MKFKPNMVLNLALKSRPSYALFLILDVNSLAIQQSLILPLS
jgi:hypothetical protein